MSIIDCNGEDITERIAAKVAILAKRERATRGSGAWDRAIAFLKLARSALDETPRPWQNDCVYESIANIEAIIAELTGEE